MLPIHSALHGHSYARDRYSPFANIQPARNSSNESRSSNPPAELSSTADFEIEWPIIEQAAYEDLEVEKEEGKEEELENEETLQGLLSQSDHGQDSDSSDQSDNHTHNHNNDTPWPSPRLVQTHHTCGLPHVCTTECRRIKFTPYISSQAQNKMKGLALPSPSPSPPPLIIYMSAFKGDSRYPPAPPPSPAWTPPPSPPYCPPYEEHQTLGAYNVPIITSARPQVNYSLRTMPPSSAGPSRLPSHRNFSSTSSIETTASQYEEYKAFDFGVSSYGADYDSAAPPPPVPLYRTTSQPATRSRSIRKYKGKAAMKSSKSSPSSPTSYRGYEKTEQSFSFFEWDIDEPSVPAIQWSKFKSSKNWKKRRGSDSDESQTGKRSVREKAGRLCKKLESAFLKSK
ncbi:hypothetical protein Dda_0372 [Drechslerella dactyloides]|uniref:Uncharacterized protein n=1 Tax=Drechslerella dactyloides TaxID=74499 RepID=A0AAD6J670_DREDA|nr:hypothetical protein Dda_0372 [Drechslerella dactyloides]